MPASFTSRSPAPWQATGADVRGLVSKAIVAKGGLERLRSIRTVRSASDMIFVTPGGEVRVKATAYVRYPGQFRIDATGPDGLRIQSFDNGVAWVSDGAAAEDAPVVVAQSMRAAVQRDTVALLLAVADDKVPARRVADVTVDAQKMPALEVDLKPAGSVTLVFDPATGLLVRQRYGGDADEPRTEEVFSDYRPVEGLQVAHRATFTRELSPPFERIVRTFEINVPIESAFFKKP